MANLYANVAQLSCEQNMALAFNMVTSLPDRIVGRSTGPAMLEVGRGNHRCWWVRPSLPAPFAKSAV